MGYLYLTLALTLNATANLLLKVGAARLAGIEGPTLVHRLLSNHALLAGLALFALNVVFYAAALSQLPLSVAYPIMVAGGIVIVVSLSVLLLQEPVTGWQMLGLCLLALGIVLIGHRSFT